VCPRTTAHASPIDALPPTTRWRWRPNMRRHPRGCLNRLSKLTGSPMLLAPVSPYHQQGSTMPSAASAAYSSRHLKPFASMGGEVPTRGRRITCMGRWHPRLLPQRQQRHCQARPIPSCRLGLLPPTLYQRWGGSAALAACRALERSHQRLVSTMSKHPGFADANTWVMCENTTLLPLWVPRGSHNGKIVVFSQK
jgi:hypothetical protein